MKGRSHRLLGRDPHRTAIGLVIVAMVSIAMLAQFALSVFVLSGERGHTWGWLYDLFAGAVIVGVALTGLLAIGYAASNGGVVLAMAIAILPVLWGPLLRGQLVLTVDTMVAVAAASCASWIAIFVEARFDDVGPSDGAIGMASASTVLAVVIAWQVVPDLPRYASPGGWFAVALIVLGIAFGLRWSLHSIGTRPFRPDSTSER